MFAFRLAQDLKMTVQQLCESMTSEEFTYCMAYYHHRNLEVERQVNETKKR